MAMRYIGAGAYIHGVPARDLSDVEAETFGAIITEQEKLTGLKMYEAIKVKAAAKKDAEEGK